MKEFIYFPSFSVGSFGQGMMQDRRLKNGLPYRFYSPDFPEPFRHPYFLVTAGHYYKKGNYKEESGFNEADDIILMGDSGGFQIASGAIKKENFNREIVLRWLENNSHIAMNLDIPPRMKFADKFDECLALSQDNFKYFADNRNPNSKTEFLNVIQGSNEYTYGKWYQGVKDFDFSGWSIGGAGTSIYNFLSALAVLMEGREQYNKNNKWLHLLGASKVIDFTMISQLQKSLNDINSTITVTTDSSSPSRAVVYGYYYYAADLSKMAWKSFHIPKEKAEANMNKGKHTKNTISDGDFHLPAIINFDKHLIGGYTYEDIRDWSKDGYAAVVLHNFMLFNDSIAKINEWTLGNEYILEQVTNSKVFRLLKFIDEMVKAYEMDTTPMTVFNKYKPHLLKLSDEFDDNKVIKHNFFTVKN